MNEGRILHCEDNAMLSDSVARSLGLSTNHRVVATAADIDTALSRVEDIACGDLDVNVLLLDGQLEGDTYNHPLAIVKRAKELGVTARIVGLSGDSLEDRGLKVGKDIDVALTKDELSKKGFDLLVKTLDDLPEPEVSTIEGE